MLGNLGKIEKHLNWIIDGFGVHQVLWTIQFRTIALGRRSELPFTLRWSAEFQHRFWPFQRVTHSTHPFFGLLLLWSSWLLRWLLLLYYYYYYYNIISSTIAITIITIIIVIATTTISLNSSTTTTRAKASKISLLKPPKPGADVLDFRFGLLGHPVWHSAPKLQRMDQDGQFLKVLVTAPAFQAVWSAVGFGPRTFQDSPLVTKSFFNGEPLVSDQNWPSMCGP